MSAPRWRACTACGETKQVEIGFHRNDSSLDGYSSRCKRCSAFKPITPADGWCDHCLEKGHPSRLCTNPPAASVVKRARIA